MTVSVGRVRPCPVLHAQVRRARPQHDSRRRRRGDAQCGADAGGGTAVGSPRASQGRSAKYGQVKASPSRSLGLRVQTMIVMKFGGTSVADQAAIERLIAHRARRAAGRGAARRRRCARADRRRVRAVGRDRSAARRRGAGRRRRRRRRAHQPAASCASVTSTVAGRDRRRRARAARGRARINREFDELERRRAALARAARGSPRWLDAHRRDRRDPQQPHRRRGARRRTGCRRRGSTRAGRS